MLNAPSCHPWNGYGRNATAGASLLVSLIAGAAIASADWLTKPYVSMGFLYPFPIMLAAGSLPRWAIAVSGVAGAALKMHSSGSLDTSLVRLAFESLALSGCGLFVGELIRNRRLSLEAQENVRVFVETSPAAIVTVDERGFIELANRAALELLLPRDNCLVGHPIAAFLPELHHALRWEEGPQFRTSMQCRGHRGNEETFMADVWFSTYKSGDNPRLAAIIADVTDDSGPENSVVSGDVHERGDLFPRETEVIRLVVQGLANKQIASQLSLSESTIKNTLQQLFAKTSVRTGRNWFVWRSSVTATSSRIGRNICITFSLLPRLLVHALFNYASSNYGSSYADTRTRPPRLRANRTRPHNPAQRQQPKSLGNPADWPGPHHYRLLQPRCSRPRRQR